MSAFPETGKMLDTDCGMPGTRLQTAWMHPSLPRHGPSRRCRSWGRRCPSAPTLDRRCPHGRSPRTTIHSFDERPRGLAQRLATTLKVLSKRGRVETHLCWWTIEPWLLARSILLRAKIRGRIQICLPKERRSKAFEASFGKGRRRQHWPATRPWRVLKPSTLHPCPAIRFGHGWSRRHRLVNSTTLPCSAQTALAWVP